MHRGRPVPPALSFGLPAWSIDRRLVAAAAAAILIACGSARAADCPRIVSQSPYITRVLESLGLADCIVGVSRYDRRQDLPRTGGLVDPDAKAIARLKPKLIIAPEWTKEEVWRAATPPGATALRVGGFRGMAGVTAMLRDIGHATGLADIDARVAKFEADWHAAAARIDGRQRRVLIMSACGKAPYSVGRGTTLHELFTAAHFVVVADHDSIRNFTADADGVGTWIAARQPELIFALKNSLDEACNPDVTRSGVPIVPLDGEHFNHPGPALLDGLEELRKMMQAIDVPPGAAS